MLQWYRAVVFRTVLLLTVLVFATQEVGKLIPKGQIAAYTTELPSDDPYIRLGIVLADVDRNFSRILSGQSSSYAFPENWSADGQQLAVADQGEIYVFSLADYQMRNLSLSQSYKETNPQWSPDGRQLAFFATTGSTMDQTIQHYVGVLDAETGHRLYHPFGSSADHVTGRPLWSSDGKLLAFATWTKKDNPYQIEIMKVDQEQLIPQFTLSENAPSNPRWSPVGNWLAFETYKGEFVTKGDVTYSYSYKEIWIIDGYTGIVRQIADDYENHPTWSPDGRSIAYTFWKRDLNPAYMVLMIADIETGHHRQLTPAGFSDTQPSWSADGRRLAVISDREGKQGVLYQIDAVTGEGQPLALIDDYVSLPPSWSPDGRWLAVFATHYTGRTSSIPRTYIVDVLNRSVISRLGEYQLGFCWQP